MAGIRLKPLHGLTILFEVLLILAAQALAFFIRFEISSWHLAAYPNLIPKFLLIILVTQLCFYYNDLYQFGRVRQLHVLVLQLLQAIGAATIVMFAIYYMFPSLHVGRGVFIPAMMLTFSFVLSWRTLLYSLSKKGRLALRTLVLGSGIEAVKVIRYLTDPNQTAYELVGLLEEDAQHLGPFSTYRKIIGEYNTLFRTTLLNKVDVIIVAIEDRRGKLPVHGLVEAKLRGVDVVEVSKFWEQEQGTINVSQLKPSWLIFSDGFRQSRLTLLLKTFGEFVLSCSLLILSLPIMAAVAVAVRVTSHGPILFRQARMGTRGRVFTLYKFRSMRIDAEADGKAKWAEENDPRVTRVGRFIRKYRLDELPQLFNVIKGEMSFVGPRPERPQFVGELQSKIPCYSQRLAVKPGVTGLAQVRMRYAASEEDTIKKLEYDLYYVKNLSLLLDLTILVDTFKVVLLGKGAR